MPWWGPASVCLHGLPCLWESLGVRETATVIGQKEVDSPKRQASRAQAENHTLGRFFFKFWLRKNLVFSK